MVRDFTRGILRENPIFVLLLGLCPSLAITTHVVNALGLGAALVVVLSASNLTVSLVRNIVPVRLRMPIFLAVVAVFVTGVDVVFRAHLPGLSERLDIFVPLIVVNCLILGRAEAFARHSTAGRAVLDGLGMGTGFLLALVFIALVREVLGAGTITLVPVGTFNGVVRLPGLAESPVRVMGLSAGALFVVGYGKALFVWVMRLRGGETPPQGGGIAEEDV
ncbi:MAG: electron transport complex subunit RsxE [Spirochaetota bacterium]